MRDRKYKFWDKHNKVWVGPYTLKQLADEDQFSSDREWQPICSQWEWFECVEYVGLKDCKGREIYEGDIVKGSGSPMRVIFLHGSFVLVDKDMERRGAWTDMGIFEDITKSITIWEVIGNIYEHPELLEQHADS